MAFHSANEPQMTDPAVCLFRAENPQTKVRCLQSLAERGQALLYENLTGTIVTYLADPSPEVQSAACVALGAIGPDAPDALADKISDLLANEEPSVRVSALEALGSMQQARLADRVASALRDPVPEIRQNACFALGRMKSKDYADQIAEMLPDASRDAVADPEGSVACGALIALSMLGAHVERIGTALGDRRSIVRAVAAQAIRDVVTSGAQEGLQDVPRRLVSLLTDSDGLARERAVEALEAFGKTGAPAAEGAAALLQHEQGSVRAAACCALGAIGPCAQDHLSAITALLRDTADDDPWASLSRSAARPKTQVRMRKPACAAAWALARIAPGNADAALAIAKGLVFASSNEDREVAAKALGVMGSSDALRDAVEVYLAGLLDDDAPRVVAAAAEAVGKVAGHGAAADTVRRVAELLKSPAPQVREHAARGLACMGSTASEHLEALLSLLGDRVFTVRAAAVAAVPALGEHSRGCAAEICRLIFDEELSVVTAALVALSEFGEHGAVFAEDISELVNAANPSVRAAAVETLRSFGEGAAHLVPAA